MWYRVVARLMVIGELSFEPMHTVLVLVLSHEKYIYQNGSFMILRFVIKVAVSNMGNMDREQ